MKPFNLLRITFFLSTLILSVWQLSAQQKSKNYVICTYLKVKPEMAEQYVNLEKVWKKIHKAKQDKNEILSWAVYYVPNSGTSSEYNAVAVTFLAGDEQLAQYYEESDLSTYTKGLSQDELKTIQNTTTFRDRVREDVYLLTEHISKEISIPNVLWLTSHKLKDGYYFEDFINTEKKLLNPIIEKLVNSGDLESFNLYSRILPSGSAADFDVVRVFGYPDNKTMLDYPAKHGKLFAEMNPNFVGLDWEIDDHTDVKVEFWKKLTCTCSE